MNRGNRYTHGAALQLFCREFRCFVCLRMRPQRNTSAGCVLRHPVEVRGHAIHIDDRGRSQHFIETPLLRAQQFIQSPGIHAIYLVAVLTWKFSISMSRCMFTRSPMRPSGFM